MAASFTQASFGSPRLAMSRLTFTATPSSTGIYMQLGGGLKFQYIAGIVFDNRQDPLAALNPHRVPERFLDVCDRTGTGELPLTNIAAEC